MGCGSGCESRRGRNAGNGNTRESNTGRRPGPTREKPLEMRGTDNRNNAPHDPIAGRRVDAPRAGGILTGNPYSMGVAILLRWHEGAAQVRAAVLRDTALMPPDPECELGEWMDVGL